jgi:hypothetical protein
MVTINEVQEAKNNIIIYKKIYKKIFYDDSGSPKLKKWLIKNGIKYNEVNDVESIMNEVFVKVFNKYNDDKISFEKYMWVKFKHALFNYFFNKKNVKKISMECSLENEVVDGFDMNIEADYDLMIDINFIVNLMNNVQVAIFKLKKDELNDFEIISKINIDAGEYYEELYKLQNLFELYNLGLL